MSESPIVFTLSTKIEAVERYIASMETRVEEARRDLGHLRATLHLFRQGGPGLAPAYMGLRRVFKRGEITAVSLAALRNAPDGLSTRELALAVMASKGIAAEEEPFVQALMASIVTMFRRMALKGQVRVAGTRGAKRMRVWSCP